MGFLGIGDGRMDLQLKSADVASGEILEGTATLTLNKDVKGKEVVAILFAERLEIVRSPAINQGRSESRRVKIYSRSETLDTEKLYTKQGSPYQYKFSFVIPQLGAAVPGTTGSTIGKIENLVTEISEFGDPIHWFVTVELNHEAMLSFPIAKTQEINIVAQPQSVSGQT